MIILYRQVINEKLQYVYSGLGIDALLLCYENHTTQRTSLCCATERVCVMATVGFGSVKTIVVVILITVAVVALLRAEF